MEKNNKDNLVEKVENIADDSKSILQFKRYKMVKKSLLLGFMLSLTPTLIVIIAAELFKTPNLHPVISLSIYVSFITYLTLFMGRKFFAMMDKEGAANSAKDYQAYAYLMPIMATVVATLFHIIYTGVGSPMIYPAILLGMKFIYSIGLATQENLIMLQLFSFFVSIVLAGVSGYLASLLLKRQNQ